MLHLCFWVTTCSHAEKRNRPTPQKPIITSISCKRFSPSKRRSWQVVAVRVHSWPSKIVISGGVCQDGYVENKFETSWKKSHRTKKWTWWNGAILHPLPHPASWKWKFWTQISLAFCLRTLNIAHPLNFYTMELEATYVNNAKKSSKIIRDFSPKHLKKRWQVGRSEFFGPF